MRAIWFERTRWFWHPVAPAGWLLLAGHALLAVVLNVWLLISASDLATGIYQLALGNSVGLLWFDWLARRSSYRDGRHLYRRQRDPESWT